MAYINRCQLMGNVGNEPEVRTLQGSSRVATFSLATSKTWTGEGGEKHEKTQWHRCVVFDIGKRKLVDVVEKFVRKGDRLMVDGEIEYREYEDREGIKRQTTEIKVKEVHLLTRRMDGADTPPAASEKPSGRAAAPKPASQPASQPKASADDDFALDDPMDDLPF